MKDLEDDTFCIRAKCAVLNLCQSDLSSSKTGSHNPEKSIIYFAFPLPLLEKESHLATLPMYTAYGILSEASELVGHRQVLTSLPPPPVTCIHPKV